METTYLAMIEHERKNNIRNGLYDYLTITMAYESGKIDQNTLTLSDTETLYHKGIVATGGHHIDHIVETNNHFELMQFMLETIKEPLTERLIKEYHYTLKKGTTDDKRYGVGKYKSTSAKTGQPKALPSYEIRELIKEQVKVYDQILMISLDEILAFHYDFEMIHPFENGNGRIGRLIMLREALIHNVTPFIISAHRREVYKEGLRQYAEHPELLTTEAKLQQEAFKIKVAEC